MQPIVLPSNNVSSHPANGTSEPLAVNVKKAAFMLDVCERSIWKLVKRGEIQTCRIGSRVVFPVASLRSFLDKGGCEQEQVQDGQET